MSDGADSSDGQSDRSDHGVDTYLAQQRTRTGVSRRSVLRTLGAGGICGLAGCLGFGQQDTNGNDSDGSTTDPSATPARTPTDTPEATPEDTPEETATEDGTDTTETSDGPVRIGMIQPLSGTLEPFGRVAVRGFYTYFGYRGADIPGEVTAGEDEFELDGTTYIVDVRDSAADPAEAQATAQSLVASDDATALVGGVSAAVAFAIADTVAGSAEVPYLAGPAGATQLTSEDCSPTVFRASETLAMDARAGASFIRQNPASTSVYIYYADYAYGRALRDAYTRLLEEAGITIAGTAPYPLGYEEWSSQLQQAADAGADTAIAAFTSFTLPSLVRAFLAGEYDFRLMSNWGNQLMARTVGSAITETLGSGVSAADIEDAGLGPFPTRYHWNQYDNPIATEANGIHRSTYGTNTDMYSSGMFTSASAIVQTVEQTGSTQRADIVDELTGMTVEETLKGQGAYTFQEYNNQARSPMTIADPVPTGNTQYWDAAVQPGAPNTTYGADQTTLPASQVDCNL